VSRSIHTTWREYARLRATDFAEPETKRAALRELRASLWKKGRIKDAVRTGRTIALPETGEGAPVPVHVHDQGLFVHHAAGEEDVREIMLRLPRGVTTGLGRVELWLGRLAQRADEGGDADPLTGRIGHEWMPGVWSGNILGTYTRGSARIWVNAYVYDRAAQPLAPVWEILLKAAALSTLVHEVAHHHDATARRARGRWRMDGEHTVEMYAEALQHEWTRSIVIPYLRERYPADVARVERWVAEHGGVALPFEALIDDPRAIKRNGCVRLNNAIWTMQEAVCGLIREVSEELDATACRVNFARQLHYREMYDEALAALSTVLAASLDHADARLLHADILEHLKRHEEALAIADPITRERPEWTEAWDVVADAQEGLGAWPELLVTATRLLELAEYDFARINAHMRRGIARLHTGDRDGAEADLASIETIGGRVAQRFARRLREALEA
jgi:tetratricopeptide (TPR) repeat protein